MSWFLKCLWWCWSLRTCSISEEFCGGFHLYCNLKCNLLLAIFKVEDVRNWSSGTEELLFYRRFFDFVLKRKLSFKWIIWSKSMCQVILVINNYNTSKVLLSCYVFKIKFMYLLSMFTRGRELLNFL